MNLTKYCFTDGDQANPPFGIRNNTQPLPDQYRYFTAVAYNQRGEFLGDVLIDQAILDRLINELNVNDTLYLVTDRRHVAQTGGRGCNRTYMESFDPQQLSQISEFFVTRGFAGVYNRKRRLGKKATYNESVSRCEFRVVNP